MSPKSLKISIIIPVLNETGMLASQLQKLQGFREEGHELILVEGGDQAASRTIAEPLVDRYCDSVPGRARQMNAGAELASGDVLLFLHIDTALPRGFEQMICEALDRPRALWGRFDIRLSGNGVMLSIIAAAMNLRSHVTGVATGDQGIFLRRPIFEELGGFAAIPLMEDIELSKRLRSRAWPVRICAKAQTSSRRWEQNGVTRTILLMWWLRLLYFVGISPEKLAIIYYK